MIDTWTCHICGEERPDENISVLTYPVANLSDAEYNVRYCNDRAKCLEVALEWKKKGEFPK